MGRGLCFLTACSKACSCPMVLWSLWWNRLWTRVPRGQESLGSMQPRERPSLYASSSLPRGRAGRGAHSSWLGVSSRPGVSVPRGIASYLPRLSAGRPVQTCSCTCGAGLTLATRDWILLVRWRALGSDSGPCFSWRPAPGGFSSPL